MTEAPFLLAPLGAEHDREPFCCGEEALDRYFKTQATQDIRRRIAHCFVTVEAASAQVAAYYTIAASSFPLVDLPAEEAKRLPRYPSVPAVRIGRLAVGEKFQGRGLGGALLVDAKNDQAVAFYQRYLFRLMVGHPRTLFLPLATAHKALLG
jgi:GNAT superfamily N-acetyltransferase